MDVEDAGWIADGLGHIPGLDGLANQIRQVYDALTSPRIDPTHLYNYRDALNLTAHTLDAHLTQYRPAHTHFQQIYQGHRAAAYHVQAELLMTHIQSKRDMLFATATKIDQAAGQANFLQDLVYLLEAEFIGLLVSAAALIPTFGLDSGAVIFTAGGLTVTAGTYTAGVIVLGQLIALALLEVETETNTSIAEAIANAIKLLEQSTDDYTPPKQDSDPNSKPGFDPFPLPIDPQSPKRDKNEECKVTDWAEFTAMFGAGYVDRIKTEHPLYGCFILKELRDIQLQRPGLLGGMYMVEGNLLLGGADSGAMRTTANNNTGESTDFQGSFFQLQWVHDHLATVRDTEVVGNDGVQGSDAEMLDGTLVEFKDYSSATLSGGAALTQIQQQVQHDRNAFPTPPPQPPHPIHFVFNATKSGGVIPGRITSWLASQGITYEIWAPEISD